MIERGTIYTPKYIYMTAHFSVLVYRTGPIMFPAKPAAYCFWSMSSQEYITPAWGPLSPIPYLELIGFRPVLVV
jgi:hypothetical protein